MMEKIYSHLVNKQHKFREMVEGFLKRFPRSSKLKPVIVVARETGSGGRPIAKLIAKKLGFTYYDKSIVELIAQRTKKREEIVKSLDEKVQGVVSIFVENLLGLDSLSRSSYFGHLCEVILSLAEKGEAVIVGRGANFIIPPEQSFRVRIIAPLKTRLYNSIKYEKNTPARARKEIYRIHFERKNFIRKYFNKNISNANYYDLVVNTENLTLEQAAKIIVSGYKAKFPKGFIRRS